MGKKSGAKSNTSAATTAPSSSPPAVSSSSSSKKPDQQQQQQQKLQKQSESNTNTNTSNNNNNNNNNNSKKFEIPKASPIANYQDDTLSERDRMLLSKMQNMKLYKPKELPKPRLDRNRGWFRILLEKYNIETALYMIEPWERWILNISLFMFFLLVIYWIVWAYHASTDYFRDFVVPFIVRVQEIIASK